MEGVQILNQFEVATKYTFNWTSGLIWLGIGAAIGLVIAIVFGLTEVDWCAFFVACVCFIPALSIAGCFLGGLGFRKPVEYETHYEVAINEETSMQEFMDKYEIIETRGSIYTVREK